MTSEEDVDEIIRRMTESSREKLKEQREESDEERKKREAQEWLDANPSLAKNISFAHTLRNKKYEPTGKSARGSVKTWRESGQFIKKDATETTWQAIETKVKQFYTEGSASNHDKFVNPEQPKYVDEEEE